MSAVGSSLLAVELGRAAQSFSHSDSILIYVHKVHMTHNTHPSCMNLLPAAKITMIIDAPESLLCMQFCYTSLKNYVAYTAGTFPFDTSHFITR